MEPNTNAEELNQIILWEADLNIFDVFALLYSYCEPKFNTICRHLAEVHTRQRMETEIHALQHTVLPPSQYALVPLSVPTRKLVATTLDPSYDHSRFDLQCFTLLRAIDESYDNMHARSINLSNFSAMSQQLNLNTNLGYVYPKQSSPISRLIQQQIAKLPTLVRKHCTIRTGKDIGDYLRDYLYNFVCLRLPAGYAVDFGGLDSTTRLRFPSDLRDCKIGVVPLIDQTNQINIELFDFDSQNKRPFRVTGLAGPDSVAQQALAILREMNENQVTLVLFPELCVPEVVRRAIADGLRHNEFPNVTMVLAGSFHERLGKDWYNIACVLGPDGQQLWQQRKLQPYTLMHYEAERIQSLARLAHCNSYEKISTDPRVIVVRDTPLGRMVVLICSDLLHSNLHRQILYDLGVNFIVVPAMCAVLEPDFTSAAEQFAIHSQATILLSNTCAAAREAASHKGNTEVKVSFAFVPARPQVWWCCCSTPAGECPHRQCSEDFLLRLGNWPSEFVRISSKT